MRAPHQYKREWVECVHTSTNASELYAYTAPVQTGASWMRAPHQYKRERVVCAHEPVQTGASCMRARTSTNRSELYARTNQYKRERVVGVEDGDPWWKLGKGVVWVGTDGQYFGSGLLGRVL